MPTLLLPTRPITCPSCAQGVQCVACYLDSMELRQLEEEHVTTLEGYADRA